MYVGPEHGFAWWMDMQTLKVMYTHFVLRLLSRLPAVNRSVNV